MTTKGILRGVLTASATLCGCLPVSVYAETMPLAEILNWQPRNNICYGVFLDPKEVANTVATKSLDQSPMNISADNTAQLSLGGQSTLSGNVTIHQPGRLLRADKATFDRNATTKTIDRIDLTGNVRYFEQKQELAGQHILINPNQREVNLWDGAYRMQRDYSPIPLSAWGTAKKAQHSPQHLAIQEATYSTCPLCPAPLWQLRAKKLDLNHEKGTATAKHVILKIKQVPLLYWPYLSFSIDKQRKSGFLLPTPGDNGKGGFTLDIPYYLNLAPNYDAIISPTFYSNRGVQLNVSTRYLTQNSTGRFSLSFLPHDYEFAIMKQEKLDSQNDDPIDWPFLSRLENASEFRKEFSLQDTTKFNQNITATATINYVSDDYYLQDFGSSPNDQNSDQLLNEADFHYADDHWDFLSRLQYHQTLHPLNSSAEDQYSRLPQLTLHGDWLFGQNHPHIGLNTEFIYFDHRKDFFTEESIVTGTRLDVRPGVALPFKTPYAFLTPRVDVEGTFYSLNNQTPGLETNITRTLPISTVDSGLFFERTTLLQGQPYTQTLEPRAYYVYIPHTNQYDIPLFDTDLPTFTYQQLFTPNRFSGYDRINDANQLTVALTTRFLDPATSEEYFSAILATEIYFHSREVCLTPNCNDDPLVRSETSPIIGAINYHFYKPWYAVANVVWDPSDQHVTTTNVHMQYKGDNNRLFSVGYDFVRYGDFKVGARSQDLSRLDVAIALPITERWHALANVNYNISHSHPQFLLTGLEYQSCCFALRAIASRSLIDQALTETTSYDNRYYLQINLKGLGNVNNGNPHSIISDRLPGYHDWF